MTKINKQIEHNKEKQKIDQSKTTQERTRRVKM